MGALATPARAAGAHVQTQRGVDHSGAATVTASITVANAAALLVVAIYVFDPGAGNPTCTQVVAAGVTNSTPDKTVQLATTDSRVYLYSFSNVATGATTAVGTCSAAAQKALYVSEFSGMATSSVLDGTGATGTGSSTSALSASGSTTSGDDVWYVVVGSELIGAQTFTAGTNVAWAKPTNGETTNGGTDPASAVEYFIATATTSTTGQYTLGTSSAWGVAMQAYKATGGGGGAAAPKRLLTLGVGDAP